MIAVVGKYRGLNNGAEPKEYRCGSFVRSPTLSSLMFQVNATLGAVARW
jgi:hypothetical protein